MGREGGVNCKGPSKNHFTFVESGLGGQGKGGGAEGANFWRPKLTSVMGQEDEAESCRQERFWRSPLMRREMIKF